MHPPRHPVLRAAATTLLFPRRFVGETERRFLQQHCEHFAPFRQVTLIFAFAVWMAFLPLELDDFPHGPTAITLRLVVAALVLAVLATSFAGRLRDERAWTIAMLLGGLSMTAVEFAMALVVVPYPDGYSAYYPGGFVIVIGLFAFTHILSRPAAVSGAVILAQLALFNVLSETVDPLWTLSTIPLLLICHSICVRLELYERERFTREGLLERAVDDERHARRDVEQATELLVLQKERERSAALQANRAKSKFLAEAAHDLRQPMQALGNYLDAASAGARSGGDADVHALLAAAKAAANETRATFAAVLELSTLEAAERVPSYEHFDLAELVRAIAWLAAGTAARTSVSVRLLRCERPAPVRSDRTFARRILENLVYNAIKYSDPAKGEGRRVVIGLVRLPTRVRIDVVDNGIGIAEDDLARVFRPFFQAGRATHDPQRGVGLGLSIVNAMIATLSEHQLVVTSALGHGTRFSIDVPLSQAPPLPEPAPMERGAGASSVIVVMAASTARESLVADLSRAGHLCEAAAAAELAALLKEMPYEAELLLVDPHELEPAAAAAIVQAEYGHALPMDLLPPHADAARVITSLQGLLARARRGDDDAAA
ncbi:HAMP domain-containing histidine kinase [Aquincola sp. S2]|uniref:histidine kinase n=1 Tax=Pseudaquabacterium terrae TaxID=2732868 RepID=A0ABX2EID6_9BURK|nr:HAMP domain-containing sensor histidine kinase [Aquabacterium terrae]NRF68397.1 HAMP domain-containing histidine kinase [Aquabacterium terrae]